VFEQLAAAILRAEISPGETLPPERVLAEQFDVSRLIVRQALHRLEEMRLVRVKQGGSSIALDPALANDIRLIGLYYRLDLSPAEQIEAGRDMLEKQFMQGLSLIEVANRRASEEERAEIQKLARDFDETTETDQGFLEFEERFWRAVGLAGKNRIFMREVSWWYETLPAFPPPPTQPAPLGVRIAFYRELARRLVERASPGSYYLAVVTPILDALFQAGVDA
jgi:DNA-binding FadR family transcriptional regulator